MSAAPVHPLSEALGDPRLARVSYRWLEEYIYAAVTFVAGRRKVPGEWRDDAAAVASRLRRYEKLWPGARDSIIGNSVVTLSRFKVLAKRPKAASSLRLQEDAFSFVRDPFGFLATDAGCRLIIRTLDAECKAFVRAAKQADADRASANDLTPSEIELLVTAPKQPLQELELLEWLQADQAAAGAELQAIRYRRDVIEAAEDRVLTEQGNAWFQALRTPREKEVATHLIRTDLSDRTIEELTGMDRRRVSVLRSQLTAIADAVLTVPPASADIEISADQPLSVDEHAAVGCHEMGSADAAQGLSGGNELTRPSADSGDYSYARPSGGSRSPRRDWNRIPSKRFVAKDAIRRSRLVWNDPQYVRPVTQTSLPAFRIMRRP